jgi:hypothetical protein
MNQEKTRNEVDGFDNRKGIEDRLLVSDPGCSMYDVEVSDRQHDTTQQDEDRFAPPMLLADEVVREFGTLRWRLACEENLFSLPNGTKCERKNREGRR